MLGLRQNLRILTPGRHALFLLSNRLCRHQHESFKGEKDLSVVAATNHPSQSPLQKIIITIKQKEEKTLGIQS
jgi:hypothetical protein